MTLDPSRRDHYPAEAVAAMETLGAQVPRPVRVGNVRVGTCSWTDPTLLRSGLWYPRGASSAEARLRFYASQFSVVEVDASFYALPTAATAQLWVDRTPVDFVFDLKAFASITGHAVDVDRLPRDLHRELPTGMRGRVRSEQLPKALHRACDQWFRGAVEPLVVAGKLGCVLLQLPPHFEATRGNARKVEALRERFPGLPLAVEFRHDSWLTEDRRGRVLDLLRAHEMSLVAVDTPGGAASALPAWCAVSEPSLAVVRFHGRNRATWSAPVGSAAERFDHLYDEGELEEWVAPIRKLSDEAGQVHALMNNCTYNAAQLNGYGLGALLAREGRAG